MPNSKQNLNKVQSTCVITEIASYINSIFRPVKTDTTPVKPIPSDVKIAIAKAVWLGLSYDETLNNARSMSSSTRFTTVINKLDKKTKDEIKFVASQIASTTKAFYDASPQTKATLLSVFKASLYMYPEDPTASGRDYYIAFSEGGLTQLYNEDSIKQFYTENYQTLSEFVGNF